MQVIIRKANKHDIPAIAFIHVNSWQTTYKGIIADGYLKSLSVENRARRWQNSFDNSNIPYVAEVKNNVIGFIDGGLSREADMPFDAEIYSLYILHKWQNMKIGKKLFSTLVNDHIRNNMHSMMVWVLRDNPAVEFYKKMGGNKYTEKEIAIGEQTLIEEAYSWNKLQ